MMPYLAIMSFLQRASLLSRSFLVHDGDIYEVIKDESNSLGIRILGFKFFPFPILKLRFERSGLFYDHISPTIQSFIMSCRILATSYN